MSIFLNEQQPDSKLGKEYLLVIIYFILGVYNDFTYKNANLFNQDCMVVVWLDWQCPAIWAKNTTTVIRLWFKCLLDHDWYTAVHDITFFQWVLPSTDHWEEHTETNTEISTIQKKCRRQKGTIRPVFQTTRPFIRRPPRLSWQMIHQLNKICIPNNTTESIRHKD